MHMQDALKNYQEKNVKSCFGQNTRTLEQQNIYQSNIKIFILIDLISRNLSAITIQDPIPIRDTRRMIIASVYLTKNFPQENFPQKHAQRFVSYYTTKDNNPITPCDAKVHSMRQHRLKFKRCVLN